MFTCNHDSVECVMVNLFVMAFFFFFFYCARFVCNVVGTVYYN